MNIININSSIEITDSQKSFIEDILSSYDNDHKWHYRREDSFHCLSKKIPVFLVNTDIMDRSKDDEDDHKDDRDNNKHGSKPITEWFGFYTREKSLIFDNTPIIAICPDRIAQHVKTDEEFMFLTAKVIVHEFAHAKMDFRNQNEVYHAKNPDYRKFYKWMEESSANRYTLEVFERFTSSCRRTRSASPFRSKSWGSTLFDYVKNFIQNQPDNYALGLELFKKYPVWELEWENKKSLLDCNARSAEIDAWLRYMQSHYSNIDRDKASLLFEAVFEGAKKAKQEDSN